MTLASELDSLRRDTAYVLRGLRRSPVFVVVAVLSLALGIGANAAIFSLIDVVLLRSLPVADPNRLEQVTLSTSPTASGLLSYPIFVGLRDGTHVFQGLFVRAIAAASILVDHGPDRGVVEVVSGNYFSTLGVRTRLGRALEAADDEAPMASPVAVIGFDAWQRWFRGDPGVLGHQIRINNHPFTIVGVAPEGFFGIEVGTNPDFWVPAMMQPAVFGPSGGESFHQAGWRCWSVFGRRNLAVSREAVQAAISAEFARLQAAGPSNEFNLAPTASIHVVPAADGLSRLRVTFRSPLLILMGAVALVLLMACANVANLLLARSAARRHDTALLVALGASHFRVIRWMLIESGVLAGLGGWGGALIAVRALPVLQQFLPVDRVPIALRVPVDGRTLWVVGIASVMAGFLCGLAPAIRAARVDVPSAMTRRTAGAASRFEVRRVLVGFQVAVSLVLVAGTGLFVESFRNAVRAGIGLHTEDVLTATLNPAQIGYTQVQLRIFYQRLQTRLEQIPGVIGAGATEDALLTGQSEEVPVRMPEATDRVSVLVNKVGGRFFEAAGIAIVRGSAFSPVSGPVTSVHAVLNEAAAKSLFGGRDPIGQSVTLVPQQTQVVEVVGIVRDSTYRTIRESAPPTLYLSFDEETDPTRERTVYVRVPGNPARAMTALRSAVQELDPNLPLYGVKTLDQQKTESLATERLIATLSTYFGALSLLLAAIGLYGVIANTTQARTREIAIKLSLGSSRTSVLLSVVGEALALAGAGVAIGLLASSWLARVVESQLFGVSAGSPAVFIDASAVLASVALLASAVPAWKAASLNLVAALRSD